MKRTTRNNILRYVISAAFVTTFLIGTLLICIGLDWLTDKTGWPIFPSFCIICFVYAVWRVGKGITVSEKKEEAYRELSEWLDNLDVVELSDDLEEAAKFYAATHTEFFDSECNPHVAPAFIAGAMWQKEQLKDK